MTELNYVAVKYIYYYLFIVICFIIVDNSLRVCFFFLYLKSSILYINSSLSKIHFSLYLVIAYQETLLVLFLSLSAFLFYLFSGFHISSSTSDTPSCEVDIQFPKLQYYIKACNDFYSLQSI